MFFSILRIVLGTCLLLGVTGSARAQDYAVTVYGGRVTEDRWLESLSPNVNFADAYILVGALAWPMKRLYDGALTFELEGQVAKYFGEQEHFEFNLAVPGRWHKFRWDKVVDTSFAFGFGLSWASEEPEVEVRIKGTTKQFLGYWFAEITLGPPDTNWAVVFRLHHRSKAFGLFAEEGGSNSLTAGLKFHF
ncbi:MAG: hypothetical protein ABUK14_06955 [Desulfobacteria bacterium]